LDGLRSLVYQRAAHVLFAPDLLRHLTWCAKLPSLGDDDEEAGVNPARSRHCNQEHNFSQSHSVSAGEGEKSGASQLKFT
jgi:hypothetical protein